MSLASASIKFQLKIFGKHARSWSPLVTGTSIVDLPGSGYEAHGLRIQKRDGAVREILDLFIDDAMTWQLYRHWLAEDGKWAVNKQPLGLGFGGYLTTNNEVEEVLGVLKMYVVSRP